MVDENWRVIREDTLNQLLLQTLPLENITNELQDKPTFKPNKNLGEGQASQSEWNYREDILNLLNRLYKAIKKIDTSNLTDAVKIQKKNIMIDDFITEGQKLVQAHIQDVFKEKNKIAANKLKALGIDKKPTPIPSDAQAALTEYQRFAIEKTGESIRLTLLNNYYRNNYFRVAYGKSE